MKKRKFIKYVEISLNEDLENTKTDYTKFKIFAELVLDKDEHLSNLEQNTTKSDKKKAEQTETTTVPRLTVISTNKKIEFINYGKNQSGR